MSKFCPPHVYNQALDLLKEDPAEGLKELERLHRKYPKDPHVEHSLGIALLQTGDPEEALPYLEHSTPRSQTPEAYLALMVAYSRLGMTMHAAQAASQARQRGARGVPDVPEPEAQIHELRGDIPAAKVSDLLQYERARYDITHGRRDSGLNQMKAFSARFPEYVPAINNLATAYYLKGDLRTSRQYVERVLSLQPDNIHALVHLARLELLEKGLEAAKELTPRVEAARVKAEEGIIEGELVRAQYYALFDDDAGVSRNLEDWEPDPEKRLDLPQSATLQETLEARQEGSTEPYYQLVHLLPTEVIEGWMGLSERKATAKIGADLRTMPGFVSLMPARLGFEEEPSMRLFAAILLSESAPPLERPWPEVLKQIALEGPGDEDTRMKLGFVLVQRGLINEEDRMKLPGKGSGEAHLLEIEITEEPEPTPLTPAEQKEFEKAHGWMLRGSHRNAAHTFGRLSERYPNHPSTRFNYLNAALAANQISQEEFDQAIRDLSDAHPDYLFAKVMVAYQAMDKGDLETARKLLAIPKDKRKFHISEYTHLMSAQGRLALIEGNFEMVRNVMETLKEMDPDGLPMRNLLTFAAKEMMEEKQREKQRKLFER